MIHPFKIPLKRLSDNAFPRSLETVSQFVIPAKFVHGGREPGSRKNLNILNFHWIPDIRHRRIPE
jgi:hypothetical protein